MVKYSTDSDMMLCYQKPKHRQDPLIVITVFALVSYCIFISYSAVCEITLRVSVFS